jgi:hypothetical protein
MQRFWTWANATIEDGSATSSSVDIRAAAIFALYVPTGFDGTELDIEVSPDNANWVPLTDDADTPATVGPVAVSSGNAYDLPVELAPWPFFRFVSDANQSGNDIDLIVTMKG